MQSNAPTTSACHVRNGSETHTRVGVRPIIRNGATMTIELILARTDTVFSIEFIQQYTQGLSLRRGR